MTTNDKRYTVIERDHYGTSVNTIAGLDELSANNIVAILQTGTAYQGSRPHTCEVVAEPSQADRTAAAVVDWHNRGAALSRAEHLAACVQDAANRFASLGARDMPKALLSITVHLLSHATPDDERKRWVEEIAAALDLKTEMPASGHYGAGDHSGGPRVITIVAVEPDAPAGSEHADMADPDSSPPAEESGERPRHYLTGGYGGDGECGSDCACGTSFSGFTDPAELDEVFAKHCAEGNAAPAITDDRVEEIRSGLNGFVSRVAGSVVDYGRDLAISWAKGQPEVVDARWESIDYDAAEVHLFDGTVIVWTGQLWECAAKVQP